MRTVGLIPKKETKKPAEKKAEKPGDEKDKSKSGE